MVMPPDTRTCAAGAAPSEQIFSELRPRLFALAYRVLRSRADAEDVVQDAWLRWRDVDLGTLRSETAWLVRVTSRLAIDRLRALRHEPLMPNQNSQCATVEDAEYDVNTPETAAELASEVSAALWRILERLTQEERAAFLLHQVFDEDYADIASALGRSQANCRQMVHRAVERIRLGPPRFEVSLDSHRDLLGKFKQAAAGPNTAHGTLTPAPSAFSILYDVHRTLPEPGSCL